MSNPNEKPAIAEVSDENSGVTELRERYENKGKVVALSNDDQEAFLAFVESIGSDNYKDWTVGAPASFNGAAMVQSDETKVNRLISIPSDDDLFADPTVRAAMARWARNRIVNAALADDASPAQFITVAGCFKQRFDLDAYKFQAKALTKFLRTQGLAGVTNNSLRMSFASAAFAKTQFPRIPDAAWDKIIGIAEKTAKDNNYDTSIFDHWKATRAVQTADTSELELDFSALESAENSLTEAQGDTTPATPAAS